MLNQKHIKNIFLKTKLLKNNPKLKESNPENFEEIIRTVCLVFNFYNDTYRQPANDPK